MRSSASILHNSPSMNVGAYGAAGGGASAGGAIDSSSSSSTSLDNAALVEFLQSSAAPAGGGSYRGPHMDGYNPSAVAPGANPLANYGAAHHGGADAHARSTHRYFLNALSGDYVSQPAAAPPPHGHHHHAHQRAPNNNNDASFAAFFTAAAGPHYGNVGAAAAAHYSRRQQQQHQQRAAAAAALTAAAAAAAPQNHMNGVRMESNNLSLSGTNNNGRGLEAAQHQQPQQYTILNALQRHHQELSRHAVTSSTPAASSSCFSNMDFMQAAAAVSASPSPLDDHANNKSNGAFPNQVKPPAEQEAWLDEIKLDISSLSLETLSGSQIVERLCNRMTDVVTKFLPCVDFLVQCQQELRKGLALAQQKRIGSSRRYYQSTLTPRQFWSNFVDPLPNNFLSKYRITMDSTALSEAVKGLETLRQNSKDSISNGCEAVKNSFLGGMKEGESWGLRKWLSKHGNALAVCTDLECILKACKVLDKSLETTKKLAALLRPMAKSTLTKLKKDVPSSYQERSSAHPYLPFFHRLEGALRDMSQFDPEDDGVICLDDSDSDEDDVAVVQVVKPPAPPPAAAPPPKKRKRSATTTILENEDAGTETDGFLDEQLQEQSGKRRREETAVPGIEKANTGSSSGESDTESVCEVVGEKTAAWFCESCEISNETGACKGCGKTELESSHDIAMLSKMENIFNQDDFDFELEDGGQHTVRANTKNTATKRKPKAATKKKSSPAKGKGKKTVEQKSHYWPVVVPEAELQTVADRATLLGDRIDNLAGYFESGRESEVLPIGTPRGTFWNGGRYGEALRIFSSMLRNDESVHFLERVVDDRLIDAGLTQFTHIVKHPISLSDIAYALLNEDDESDESSDYNDGRLPGRDLASWNMWRGMDLLQAVDLVLLNSLAYGKLTGEGRSRHRGRTNELRKTLWNRINDIVQEHAADDSERRRQYTPTKRSETSGFVVYKIREKVQGTE